MSLKTEILNVEFSGRCVVVTTKKYGQITSGIGMLPTDTITETTYEYVENAYQFQVVDKHTTEV